jgi:hypothetical protein
VSNVADEDSGVGRADVENIDLLCGVRLDEEHSLNKFSHVQIGLPLRAVSQYIETVWIRAQSSDEVEKHAVGRGQSHHVRKAKQQRSAKEFLGRRSNNGLRSEFHGAIVGNRERGPVLSDSSRIPRSP